MKTELQQSELKEQQTSPGIRTIAFEILERCNLFCDFCVRSASYKLKGQLSPEQFAERCQTVARSFPNLQMFALTGGEPFLHADIVEMVKIARRVVPTVSITTNATVHRFADLEKIRSIGAVHLIVSLDGPTAEVHDLVRGREGAFDGLVKFLAECRRIGMPFLINHTVNEKNYRTVYETIKVVSQLGALDISVALVKPEGRGREIPEEAKILADLGRQMLLAQRDFGRDNFIVRFTDPLAFIFDVRLAQPNMRRGCGASSGSLHIQCDGTSLLCTSCKESLGNIDDKSVCLAERVNTDQRTCAINSRDALGQNCGSCEFNKVCGGCRCRSISINGFLGGDPLCPKNVCTFDDPETESAVQLSLAKLLPSKAKSTEEFREWLQSWAEPQASNENGRIWTHNFHLGKGQLFKGEYGWRHLTVLRNLLKCGALPRSIEGMRILDAGAMTGVQSCILSGMGAHVDACEDSDDFVESIKFLSEQFSLPVNVVASAISDVDGENLYDFVFMTNPYSRVSDHMTALKSSFKLLKSEGSVLIDVETSQRVDGEDELLLTRQGKFHWLLPSRRTLLQSINLAGFKSVRVVDFDAERRIVLWCQKAANGDSSA